MKRTRRTRADIRSENLGKEIEQIGLKIKTKQFELKKLKEELVLIKGLLNYPRKMDL